MSSCKIQPISVTQKSIPSSQILRVKRICSTNSKLEHNCKVLHEHFTKRRYDSSSIETETKKIKFVDWKDWLTLKTTQKVQVLPFTVTYNGTLPDIKQLIQNHGSILKTNKALEKTFSVEPIIAFRKNKSLKQLIGGSTIQNDKDIKKSSNKYEGKCTPYKSGIRSLCRYKTHIHVVANKMGGYLQFSTNCKSDFVIYLLEYKKCHMQYVGKAETDFSLRLNNHRKNAYKLDFIPA